MVHGKERGKQDFSMVEHICYRLLPAQIVLAVVGAINGVISSLFASNYVGSYAMSAVGLYNPIRLFISAVGVMLLGGSQILMGKYMGKNEREEMNGVFSMDLLASVLVGLGAMALMMAAVVLGWTEGYGGGEPVGSYFDQYLLGSAIGVLPQLLSQQLAGFLSLENRSRYTVAGSLSCVLTTTGANWLFLGVLRWEAFGMALASSLGMWVFFLVEALYYLTGRSELRLGRRGLHGSICREIWVTGLPGALSSGYMTVRSLVVNWLLLHYVGGAGLSAFATSNAFMDCFWAIPAGMCAVSRMMFSICIGEEDRQTLQNVMRVALLRYVPAMVLVAGAIMAFALPATRLYYQDPADPVFAMTVMGLRILPLCMPFSVICMHFVCYGQASSDKQLLIHLLSVIDGVLGVAAFALLLTPAFGIAGVYAANVLSGVVVTAVVVLYAWLAGGRFPRTMEQLMVISDGFGVPEEDRIDIAVRRMEDVVQVSRKVQGLCRSRGIDERRAYFAALAVEEMAGNVVQHGFSKDNRPHCADIRVSCKGDRLILRIKDDCRPFDPADRQRIMDPGDPAGNVGIRMVYNLCRDIEYSNILGMNALTVRL